MLCVVLLALSQYLSLGYMNSADDLKQYAVPAQPDALEQIPICFWLPVNAQEADWFYT